MEHARKEEDEFLLRSSAGAAWLWLQGFRTQGLLSGGAESPPAVILLPLQLYSYSLQW